MSFPRTRLTLIERLTSGTAEDDWRDFMVDYWRPVCRFAARWGKLNADDAEDVASVTFQVLIGGNLLARWTQNRSAKLRTLLCSVVRNVLSNRARNQSGRSRLLQENRELILELSSVQALGEEGESDELAEPFYATLVDELLQDTAEALLQDYLREGRGDYFRVLYGRICEQMTSAEIGESLGLPTTTVENYYRHAKRRLGQTLKRLLERRLRRYCAEDRLSEEFQSEWQDLNTYLSACGGIERALRDSHSEFDSSEFRRREHASVNTTMIQIRELLGPETGPDKSQN